MKKKIIFLLLTLINISYFCVAQPPADGPLKRAEALHVAYMTKELAITTSEAQAFWPIYRNYIDELRAKRKDSKGDPLVFEEDILNIRKKYKPDFKKVLGSEERVNKMFIVEKNFREILKRELMDRRMRRQGFKDQE